jgi:acetyl-CoA C-acetyltransferase
VAAGVHDVVLVVGAGKLKDRGGRGLPRFGPPLLARGNLPPGFALAATRYMETFGVGRETLAKVAVKNHKNGALNEKAHLRSEITVEQALKSPIIASPFGLFDCCPTTDGAAAAIVCRADLASKFKKPPIWVKGAALAVETGRPYFDPTFDYLGFPSTVKAAQAAYEMAGIGPRDVSFAEVHDCFTWTEISNTEDLGFCKKGEGWKLAEEGRTARDGDIPINPSGGLKSFGHPIGASGVRMIYEVVTQLRGEAGARQVKSPVGIAHNVGGSRRGRLRRRPGNSDAARADGVPRPARPAGQAAYARVAGLTRRCGGSRSRRTPRCSTGCFPMGRRSGVPRKRACSDDSCSAAAPAGSSRQGRSPLLRSAVARRLQARTSSRSWSRSATRRARWLRAIRLERVHLPEYGIAALLAWRAHPTHGRLRRPRRRRLLASLIGWGDEPAGITPAASTTSATSSPTPPARRSAPSDRGGTPVDDRGAPDATLATEDGQDRTDERHDEHERQEDFDSSEARHVVVDPAMSF